MKKKPPLGPPDLTNVRREPSQETLLKALRWLRTEVQQKEKGGKEPDK